MASMARLTGPITFINVREGEKDGRPWRMENATVLVGGRGTAEVTLPRPDRVGGQTFREGDQIDFLVNFEVGYRNQVSAEFVDFYPQSFKESEADALLAFAGDSPADLS
jgi:hypothetical protein